MPFVVSGWVTLRTTIVVNSLGAGGAERQAALLANYLAESGHETTVITYKARRSPELPDHWRLDDAVRRTSIEFGSRAPYLLRKAFGLSLIDVPRKLRSSILGTKPDVVVSFIDKTNVMVLLSLIGTGLPIVVSERVHFPMHDIGPRWRMLRRLAYPLASVLVTQTRLTAEAAAKIVPASEIRVIPNVVMNSPAPTAPVPSAWTREPTPSLRIAAVGRLTPQKGFDVLIQALSSLVDDVPGAELVILGEGPARQSLETLAKEVGVGERVQMPGIVLDVRPTLTDSDVFVLSSRFEGFPNALVEAMACGLAVIATRCPSGPTEIVTDGVDGLLVPVEDPEAIASALRLLAQDDSLRSVLGNRARLVTKRFAPDVVFPLWDEALKAAVGT